MTVLNLQKPPLMSAAPSSGNPNTSLLVAFTTPPNYAGRLTSVINLKGWCPLWCPSVIVESTPQTISSIQWYLSNPNSKDFHHSNLEEFSAIAFTSRTGILAFTEALDNIQTTPLAPHGEPFTISALGKDSELLNESFIHKVCENPSRMQVVVPPVATPSMVELLGLGHVRKVLCSVPSVVGLNEPTVVPTFLRDLAKMGWNAVRVNTYETRWAGLNCAEELFKKTEGECGLGLNWDIMRRRCPRMVVAAHGPVTASGAERMGIGIDVISSRFDSFDGVVDALVYRWNFSDSYGS